jgi:hypothetical protein
MTAEPHRSLASVSRRHRAPTANDAIVHDDGNRQDGTELRQTVVGFSNLCGR